MKRACLVLWCMVGALAWVAAAFQSGPPPKAADPQAGESAGSEVCATCHSDQQQFLRRNVHSHAAERGTPAGVTGCEACHGPARRHAEDPAAKPQFTFARGEEQRSNTACLGCHRSEDRVADFHKTPHARHGVACVNCHASPHAPQARLPQRLALRANEAAPVRPGRHLRSDSSELCLTCHVEVRGRMRLPYRHPVAGQAVSCVSCHDPHKEERGQRRGTNALCFSCHEDKRGPWAYEHAAAAEDCASCHDPHGSVAPGLLKTAQPFLCLSCHSIADDRHGAEVGGTRFSRAFFSRCTACHGAIHGSHEDRYLKR